MLALLSLVVLFAIGCVLWFMREAMRNERLAVREKLSEAYRSHLVLVRNSVEQRWQEWRTRLEEPASPPAQFERAVHARLADAVICLGPDGEVTYPQLLPAGAADLQLAEELTAELRSHVKSGDKSALAQFVLDRFSDERASSARDANGRLIAASAELIALEQLGDRSEPHFESIAQRLRTRLLDYSTELIPGSQRRFLMRAMQRLEPGASFSDTGGRGACSGISGNAPTARTGR